MTNMILLYYTLNSKELELMMKRMLKNHLLSSVVILSSVLWGGTVFADNVRNNIESFELDPVLVTATRYETRDLEIPAATEIFDQKKIEKLGANNVMEVVRNIPGFTLTASPTGNTYVGFRGVSKDNVAILVNGIPLNQDGNYDLESISTDIIDRIEVVKGGSAVLYGSNASAGVINIITNKKQGTNKVLIGWGDKNKFKGAVNVATDKLQVSYSRQQSKGRGKVYQSSPTSFYMGDNLEKDSLNLQYNITDNLLLQYMYSKKISDCSRINNGQYAPGFHSDIQYHFGQMRYSNNDMSAAVYMRSRDWKYNTTTHQKGHNIGADIQNKWLIGKVGITAGANYENENTKNTVGTDSAKRDSGAVFFMTETQIGAKTKMFLGAREAYVEESGSKFCPQFQLLQNIGENENIYLNINKSMRAPNINEQWGTATQLMNPDLKAESGWNYELGRKKKITDNDLLKLNIFHMDIDDRIYRAKDSTSGLNIYKNAEKYRNTGVELSYEKALSKKFSYNLGMSYANPQQKTITSSEWERTDFKFGLNAGIGYQLDKNSANIFANYMTGRVNGTKPMLDINMNVSHKLTDKDVLKLTIYNLLNRDDIRTGSSSGTSGALLEERNWMLTYERTF